MQFVAIAVAVQLIILIVSIVVGHFVCVLAGFTVIVVTRIVV